MLARPLFRTALRRQQQAGGPFRRFQSTTTEKAAETAKSAADSAKGTASGAASKASQGLSRVTSAAGPAIANAAKGVTGALGRIGGRTGRIIAFVEKQTPKVIYYSRVGLELSKLVFKGQNMSPPSVATFQSYYRSLWASMKQPGKLVDSAMQSVNSVRSGGFSQAQLIAGGVLFAECLGFFTVGEMLGRRKLIGYHGEPAGHH